MILQCRRGWFGCFNRFAKENIYLDIQHFSDSPWLENRQNREIAFLTFFDDGNGSRQGNYLIFRVLYNQKVDHNN
jgi:hypothetical protein